ncbi:hypothetical protein BB560_003820, partial [Smittium megazygosporum]
IVDSWGSKGYFNSEVISAMQDLFKDRSFVDIPVENKKVDIIRKMEDDRENHKKIKEGFWIRDPNENRTLEFEELLDSVSDLNKNDWIVLRSELEKSRIEKSKFLV